MFGGEKKYLRNFGLKTLKEKSSHLKNLNVDEIIILKRTLQKYDGKTGTGLICFKLGELAVFCEGSNGPSVSITRIIS